MSARPLLLPALALAILCAVLALPDLAGAVGSGTASVTAYQGRLVTVVANPTPLQGGTGFSPDATVLMLEGPDAGHDVPAYLQGPGGTEDLSSFHPGDAVVVTYTPQPGAGPFIAVTDHWRLPQLGLLALLFAASVVLVGGWRGARALLALGITIAVIVRIVLPLVITGYPPVPLAVVAATAVTFITILLTEGWSATSVAAILGTSAALALTGLLGAAATRFAEFTTAGAADLAQLQINSTGAGLDLSGLLLAALILGSLGILEDVTMTQAVVVDELAAGGDSGVGDLYGRGLRVGRAHIAATVNTLFLAYVGASLPLMVLLIVNQQPAGQVLNGEALAVEVVRALVGSIGIVAAVPMTTILAAALVRRHPVPRIAGGIRLTDPLPALITGLVVIGVAAGVTTALMGPIGSVRQAQPTDAPLAVFPSANTSPGASEGAAATDTPAATIEPAGLPPIVDVGRATPVLQGGAELGTITVVTLDHATAGSQTKVQVMVRYASSVAAWPIDPAAWTVISGNGAPFAIGASPHTPALVGTTLATGQTMSGWFQVSFPKTMQDPFLAYQDSDGGLVFVVPLP
ncbi:MAG: YibE/F family protein [Candidatus Limnocylindrales bacterium]